MATLTEKNIHPLPGYLLIKPAEAETKTASGIYLPDSNEKKPQHGNVVAVGDAVVRDGEKVAAPVKKGDTVLYKQWGGTEIKIGDQEYQLLEFDQVLALVK